MNRRRLPFILLGLGALTKALLVALTKLGDFPLLITIATRYDPVAFGLANWGSSLLFNPKRLAPGNGEVAVFEALLVVGFGAECFLLGFVIRWFLELTQPTRPKVSQG